MITQVEFTLPFKVDSSLGSREEGREFEKTYDETVTPQIWERMDSIMGQLQDSQGSSRVALGKYNIEATIYPQEDWLHVLMTLNRPGSEAGREYYSEGDYTPSFRFSGPDGRKITSSLMITDPIATDVSYERLVIEADSPLHPGEDASQEKLLNDAHERLVTEADSLSHPDKDASPEKPLDDAHERLVTEADSLLHLDEDASRDKPLDDDTHA